MVGPALHLIQPGSRIGPLGTPFHPSQGEEGQERWHQEHSDLIDASKVRQQPGRYHWHEKS